MLPDNINDIPPKVLYTRLKVLDIDSGECMGKLLNDSPKEIMMYAKIYALDLMQEQQC